MMKKSPLFIKLMLVYIVMFALLIIGLVFQLLLLPLILIPFAKKSQQLFQSKKGYFYPYYVHFVMNGLMLIYTTFIDPDEFGFGMISSLVIFVIVLISMLYYYVHNKKEIE